MFNHITTADRLYITHDLPDSVARTLFEESHACGGSCRFASVFTPDDEASAPSARKRRTWSWRLP